MRFYKANVVVREDGKAVYGNLPYLFTVGHEIDEIAYFTLTSTVELPDDSDVIEISESDFQQVIATMQAAEEQRRQQEQTELLDKLRQKQEEIQTLKQQHTALSQDLQGFLDFYFSQP
ncbi:hypothetical protein [Brevibacillus centrosporus]|uniref:hypothetical protein n=1 Tax=Brevibacillus centrosporus TaxID=54910 RepID=UPI002E1EC9DF|nr:hypothetical protein [Brevibacillus centrosporus]